MVGAHHRLNENDPYFTDPQERWSEALGDAYQSIEAPNGLKDI
jgi:predicted proteasome-type protease